jgi:hypothetical protein
MPYGATWESRKEVSAGRNKGPEAAGHGGHTPWPAWRQPVMLVLDAIMVILPALKEHCMADDTVQTELERLRAENEALKGRAAKGMTLKVSEKGAVSIYGLGRFPVTLYKEQWEKLLGIADDIRTFLTEHEAELKTKEKEV